MDARQIMNTELKSAHINEKVGDVLQRMRAQKLRMVPVLSGDGRVAGVLSTYSVLLHLLPEYILSGDLDVVPYAPDIGVLSKHYKEIARKSVAEVMDKPLTVHADDSLLSVSTAICASGRHEYAVVVDDDQRLLGVISAGDILDRLRKQDEGACCA